MHVTSREGVFYVGLGGSLRDHGGRESSVGKRRLAGRHKSLSPHTHSNKVTGSLCFQGACMFSVCWFP